MFAPSFPSKRTHDAFRLIEHGTQQMLGLNLLILISFGQFDADESLLVLGV
jgi:hypothetical protein